MRFKVLVATQQCCTKRAHTTITDTAASSSSTSIIVGVAVAAVVSIAVAGWPRGSRQWMIGSNASIPLADISRVSDERAAAAFFIVFVFVFVFILMIVKTNQLAVLLVLSVYRDGLLDSAVEPHSCL